MRGVTRASVELRRGNDLVAGLQRCEQRGGNGGHTGRGDDSGFSPFQRGDFLLRDGQRGITVARVDVGFVFPFGPELHFFRRRKSERRRTNNLGDNGAVDAAAIGFTAVDGLGLRAEFAPGFLLHHAHHFGGGSIAGKLQIGGFHRLLIIL